MQVILVILAVILLAIYQVMLIDGPLQYKIQNILLKTVFAQ